jgi:G:T-mismatch repair DNA endonuclease (very short patch repair protein)
MDKLLDISNLVQTSIPKKKRKRRRKPSKKSSNTTPELEMQKVLTDLGIAYTTQYELEGKFYDIYIPRKNMLIEVDGVYWHGKDVEFMDKNRVQKKAFFNDLKKDGLATLNGYIIKRIWEGEITIETVKKLIYNEE